MKIRLSVILHEIIFFCILFLVPAALCGCKKVKSGMLVATEAQLSTCDRDFKTGEDNRYIHAARIIAFYPGRQGSEKILTGDFESAAWPEISCDGSHMLFAGRKESGDTWQIWEMDLKNLKYRQITSFDENCTDPVYLPGGRIVFSKFTVNDTVKSAHCLYVCQLDGSGIRQITFSPCDNYATTVLRDGRLLTISRQLIPDRGDPMLMVLRPDGTKADMFYMSTQDNIIVSNPRENSDGRIVFIESKELNSSSNRLVSISYNRPLHTRLDLTPGIGGEFYSAYPVRPDKYLVSARFRDSVRFSLFEFDPVNKLPEETLFSDPEYDILDVVPVKEYERPKKLPSEVDPQVKTGLLLCQDINFMGLRPGMDRDNILNAKLIEVLGIDSTYGIVPVEADGSFQLKIVADKPFRIRTLDEKGNILNGPCSWLWLRPNERRGCVGCHEDPEVVPANRIPLAVKQPPVIVAVNISEIKEKSVELE